MAGKWAVFDPNPSASSKRESIYFNERLPKLRQHIIDSVYRVVPRLSPMITETELGCLGHKLHW